MMITQKELKKILHYDENTGIFTWKIKPARSVKAGSIAGHKRKDGYISIKIKNKKYQAHHLAWLYVYGTLPTEQIDHINHNKADNSIDNLRDVAQKENCKNRNKSNKNTSGVVGVYWGEKNKRWIAQINVDSERIHLGCFVKFSDAVDARKNAEVLYNYHENHGK